MRPVDHSTDLPPVTRLGAVRREALRLYTFGYLMVIGPIIERAWDKAKHIIARW